MVTIPWFYPRTHASVVYTLCKKRGTPISAPDLLQICLVLYIKCVGLLYMATFIAMSVCLGCFVQTVAQTFSEGGLVDSTEVSEA